MTGGPGETSRWASRPWLLGTQYKTDANLAARQSVYAYEQPRTDIARRVIDLAGLAGNELVTDVGCGNGLYLAELVRRGHAGRVLGLDLSAGMLRAARGRAAATALLAADAVALPLADDAGDVTLAMHMLYHVPDPLAAVRELCRITRPGGRVLVGLNGDDHLKELRDLVAASLGELGQPPAGVCERVTLDTGERLLASCFGSVVRHDFTAELLIPDQQPVADYVRSIPAAQDLPDPEALVTAVTRRLPLGSGENFRIRTHSGCLVCS